MHTFGQEESGKEEEEECSSPFRKGIWQGTCYQEEWAKVRRNKNREEGSRIKHQTTSKEKS